MCAYQEPYSVTTFSKKNKDEWYFILGCKFRNQQIFLRDLQIITENAKPAYHRDETNIRN